MINLLLYIHKYCYALNDIHRYKSTSKIKWALTNIGAKSAQWMLNKLIRIRGYLNIISSPVGVPNDELIISLTTYPDRIHTVWITIDSLMRQTIRSSHLILYLSEDEFPNHDKDLPQSLLRYKKYGLEIIWVKGNLRSHKKYLYAFKQFPDKYVVTVDDDLYYRSDMLANLWNLHLLNPGCVIANNAKIIPSSDKDSIFPQYQTWIPTLHPMKGNQIIAIGCGGILYPVKLFARSEYDNVELIKSLAFETDDLWLKVQEILADIPVSNGKYYCKPPLIQGSQRTSLSKKNWQTGNVNDVNWSKLNQFYKLSI